MKKVPKPRLISQFLVVLANTDPLVWRRIHVPGTYSFWDLHVAIQDSMGWLDCHLHEFTLIEPDTDRAIRIGIPDDDLPEDRPCLAGWEVPIKRYLTYRPNPIRYWYDFGDDWNHILEFEEIIARDGGRYPRCVAGAGACPPEDVGGTHGYVEFLKIIRNPKHEDHEEMLHWAGGSFDPHAFRPDSVKFDNPKKRWKNAFQDPF